MKVTVIRTTATEKEYELTPETASDLYLLESLCIRAGLPIKRAPKGPHAAPGPTYTITLRKP